MAFKVGDRVRIVPHGDDHDSDDDGHVSTIRDIDPPGKGYNYPIHLQDEPPRGLNMYCAEELELVNPQTPQEKTQGSEVANQLPSHDYMLGYADGYRHDVVDGTYADMLAAIEPHDTDYRIGFRDGLEAWCDWLKAQALADFDRACD